MPKATSPKTTSPEPSSKPLLSTLSTLREQLEQVQAGIKEDRKLLEAEQKRFEDQTADARKALEFKESEVKELEERINAARNDTLLTLLQTDGALDALTPKHHFSSCSDDNPTNEDRGCARCALIAAKQRGYVDFDWWFEVKWRSESL